MDVIDFIKQQPWCKPEWRSPSLSNESKLLLQECKAHAVKVTDNIDELIKNSHDFPIEFPIETVRLHTLKEYRSPEELKKNISSTYPLLHEKVLVLIADFLVYKRNYGSHKEKALYKDMTVSQFIDRILKKRALEFIGPVDKYRLVTGEKGFGGWESVGTDQEQPPLTLDKCLSYDELKISALVYVSGFTSCINNGNRCNFGKRDEDNIEPNAVVIGLIGPRFKRKFCMDFQDIVISCDQNTRENGYGDPEVSTPTSEWLRIGWLFKKSKPTKLDDERLDKIFWRQLWADFYQIPSYSYDKISNQVKRRKKDPPSFKERFVPLSSPTKMIFDNEAYYKRIRVMAECTLFEANSRAKEADNFAYLNIIGCGLGVWLLSKHQVDVYVLTIVETIHDMLQHALIQHVSDVNFAFITPSEHVMAFFTTVSLNEKKIFLTSSEHPKGGINITLKSREPCSKLTGDAAGKLLVLTYPWDSNAHPGNEFWHNNLKGSGDSATASCTQVSELHNARVNPAVAGSHARVAGPMGDGVTSLSEYCKKLSE